VKDSSGRILTDGEIASRVRKLFDLRPYFIIERLGLKNPVFLKTASYGHFGKEPHIGNVEVYYEVPGSIPRILNNNGKKGWMKEVEFFAWEKLDYVDKIRNEFGI
ncbi:MAG TPA: methionine adenosyltransferase domain-containing protein, partial [Bacteroidales bacterium]|nr:methionine adenosyltransferase domain-containing protein [Bacteroidales bacterium]